MNPELRKAIEEKAEAAANANTRGITKHALIRHVFAAGAEACFEIMQVDQWAFENLTRKLNEANARIAEFDTIKAGHMKVQEEMKAENQRLRTALEFYAEIDPKFDTGIRECAPGDTEYQPMGTLARAALKDPGGV